MIVYHVYDSEGEEFLLSTDDIGKAKEYEERGFQVTSVSVK